MSKRKLTIYKNGAVGRLENRRLSIEHKSEDDTVNLMFQFATKDFEQPACRHFAVRGIRQTELRLTAEAMDAMCTAWFKYKQKNG